MCPYTNGVQIRVHWHVGTFVKGDSLRLGRIVQEEQTRDLYATAGDAIYRITYEGRIVTLKSGSAIDKIHSCKDGKLLNSLFNSPLELIFSAPRTLLVAD